MPPSVRPWNDWLNVSTSKRGELSGCGRLWPKRRAVFTKPSFASAPEFEKNTLPGSSTCSVTMARASSACCGIW